MQFILEHIGFIAGVISFSAYISYVRSVYKGETKPSRSTWWILAFVGVLVMWSSYKLGAHESIWIQLSYVVGPMIIGVLSIRYGEGSGLSALDKVCLFLALLSGLLWIIFNSPLVGFIGSIIVDFIGLVPTIKKSWIKPEEEDPTAWMIESIASLLNTLVITTWFVSYQTDWVYALYLVFVNLLITILLWRKRIFKNPQ